MWSEDNAVVYADKDFVALHTVRSMNGHTKTTVHAQGQAQTRCFFVSNVSAKVEGFTITGGNASGAPVDRGGAVYLFYGGIVQNCHIVSNSASLYGGGAWMDAGGTLRNCLIERNSTDLYDGGGVYGSLGGTVENCTIVSNTANRYAGGVNAVQGTVIKNTIMYFNEPTNWAASSPSTIDNSCTTPDASSWGSNNITNDPTFKNANAGDYRLKTTSPCVNTGTNQAWMTGAGDLGGQYRILEGTVDMGAYESYVTGTIISFR